MSDMSDMRGMPSAVDRLPQADKPDTSDTLGPAARQEQAQAQAPVAVFRLCFSA